MIFDFLGRFYTACEILVDGRLVGRSATTEELRTKNGLATPAGENENISEKTENIAQMKNKENPKSVGSSKSRKKSWFSTENFLPFLDFSGPGDKHINQNKSVLKKNKIRKCSPLVG